MPTNRPYIRVTYNDTDITSDITPDVIGIKYADATEGKTDELTIELDNSSGKWSGDWYMTKGDTLGLEYGYAGDVANAGTFTIDRISVSMGAGKASTVTIMAMAAGINSPIRTKRSQAYETQSLIDIARSIADRNGMTIEDGTARTTRTQVDFSTERAAMTEGAKAIRYALTQNTLPIYKQTAVIWDPVLTGTHQSLTRKGKTDIARELSQTQTLWKRAITYNAIPDIQTARAHIERFATNLEQFAAQLNDIDYTTTTTRLSVEVARKTQDRETDLEFLRRISKQYGVLFSVRGETLVFMSLYDIEATAGLLTIDAGEIATAEFSDKASKVYAKSVVRYHNPETAEDVTGEATAESIPGTLENTPSGDTLEVRVRAENQQQAEEIAKSELYRANSKAQTGSITLEGRPFLVAGVNVNLSGFGVFSGKWAITESSHSLDTGGYVTRIEIKRVGA